jgi:hypothetical protein
MMDNQLLKVKKLERLKKVTKKKIKKKRKRMSKRKKRNKTKIIRATNQKFKISNSKVRKEHFRHQYKKHNQDLVWVNKSSQ